MSFPIQGSGSGSGGGSFVIDDNHFFNDNTARDAYFALHPDELITGTLIKVGAGYQQYDGASWDDVTAVVTGPKGDTGATGAAGAAGAKGDKGDTGEKGDPGEGVPEGGTTNQILKKSSNDNYDTEWTNMPSGGDITADDAWVAAGDLIVGSGENTASILTKGSEGQVLKVGSTTLEWGAVTGTGDVVGPSSAISNNFASYDGVTGKLIKDSGLSGASFCLIDDSRLTDSRTPTSHDNTYHSATYITSSGVTYENLNSNGDVGTSESQVAAGNHNHSGTYQPADAELSLLAALSLAGNASKVIAVNTEADAFELVTPSSGETYTAGYGIDITDEEISVKSTEVASLPETWVANQYLRTTATDGVFEYTATTSDISSFTDLDDVPSSYSGNASKLIGVNATADGLEFTTAGAGDVVGPALSITNNFASFSDESGKVLKDSGLSGDDFVLTNDSRLTDSRTPTSHGNEVHTSTFITALDVTYENLSSNGDVGSSEGTLCAGNDSRLSDARTPTSHAHGSITNDGKIGETANLPIITTTDGALTTGSFGTDANTFCQGNDSRLSDTRTPSAHNLIDTTGHPVSGLTSGHFLKATGETTYGFGAHGLTYSDVGAAASDHNHSGTYQPADSELSLLASLSISGNANKVIAVNSGADAFELVDQSGGETYTAGYGINIDSTVISIDSTEVASLPEGWANNKLLQTTEVEGVFEFIDSSSFGITDVPDDGKIYARSYNQWVEFATLTYSSNDNDVNLPESPEEGDTFDMIGTGTAWTVNANAGQYIRLDTLESISGGTASNSSGFGCASFIYIGTISGHNTWLIKSAAGTINIQEA